MPKWGVPNCDLINIDHHVVPSIYPFATVKSDVNEGRRAADRGSTREVRKGIR